MTGLSQTEEFIKKTLNRITDDPAQKAAVYSELADLYFNNVPEKGVDQARDCMRQAVDAIESIPTSRLNRQTAAEIYINWGLAEYSIGDNLMADKYIEAGKQRHPHSQREWWKKKLEKDIAEAKALRAVQPPPPANNSGSAVVPNTQLPSKPAQSQGKLPR